MSITIKEFRKARKDKILEAVLNFLHKHKNKAYNPSEIARVVKSTRQTVWYACRKLVSKGNVEKRMILQTTYYHYRRK